MYFTFIIIQMISIYISFEIIQILIVRQLDHFITKYESLFVSSKTTSLVITREKMCRNYEKTFRNYILIISNSLLPEEKKYRRKLIPPVKYLHKSISHPINKLSGEKVMVNIHRILRTNMITNMKNCSLGASPLF